jgi:hypothetical protein
MYTPSAVVSQNESVEQYFKKCTESKDAFETLLMHGTQHDFVRCDFSPRYLAYA